MTRITGWDLPKTIGGIPKMDISNASEIGGGDLKARTTITNALTSKHLKCSNEGVLETSVNRLQGLTDIDDVTTIKNIKVTNSGSLKVDNEEITSGSNTTLSQATQVLNYGKDITDATIRTLGMNGNYLLVNDVVNKGIMTDGTQKTQIYGNSNAGGSGTNNEVVVNASGAVLVINDGGVEIDAKNDAGVQKDLRCDNNGRLFVGMNAYTDNTDDTTATKLKCSSTGSLLVKQDDHASVTIQGVSDQANPFGTKKPLLIATTGSLVTNPEPQIVRGSVTFPTPYGADAVSTSIDMGNLKTLNFHFEGSMGGTHEGFIIQGSNDNSNFVKVQLFLPQTVSTIVSIRGSITKGYRYYRMENGGDSTSVTTSLYNAYN